MKRISAIDMLKGLMLGIIVDHLGTPLKTYTWETLGGITATEGFLLPSGILTGMVYRRRVDRTPTFYRYQRRPFLVIVLIYLHFPNNVGYAYYRKQWLNFFNPAPLQALEILFVLRFIINLTVPAMMSGWHLCIASARIIWRGWHKQLIPVLTKFP